MNGNVNKILQNIVSTAAMAATEAKTVVSSAGKAVAEKYDEVKLNVEFLRLSEEQEDVFSDIGRMLFLMHTGVVKDTVMSDEGEKTPQQVIDSLLVNAEQIGQQMDAITARLAAFDDGDEKICPACGRICDGHDAFCAVCGTRLDAAEAPAADAPASDVSAPDAPEAGAEPSGTDAPEV